MMQKASHESICMSYQSKHISLKRLFIVFFLCIGTFLILQNISGVRPTPILKPLSLFPKKIGDYRFVAAKTSSQGVIDLLGVNDYINYNYISSSGILIDFYLAYYESVGGSSTYHSPKNCLPGSGWGISSVKTVQVSPKEDIDKKVPLTEMTLQSPDSLQIVLYWYQNRGRTISSEYWEKIYLVLDALFKGRRDGSFVRIIANVPEGKMREIQQETRQFAELVLAELSDFIPGEE